MNVADQQFDPSEVVAVVVGRAGSKGLPGKNLLPIGGLPMIAHSIGHAFAARSVGRVVCSTDGSAIAAAAADAGAEVVLRPSELATDDATVDSAVRHAVRDLEISATKIVILYGNIPIRPVDLIDRAVQEKPLSYNKQI